MSICKDRRWKAILIVVLCAGVLFWIIREPTRATLAAAASSVVIAFATLALVGVTWRYVVLTRELVESNVRQVQLIEAREQTAKRQEVHNLRILCHRLTRTVEELYRCEVNIDRLRQVAIWDEDDMHDLRFLVANLGTKAEHVSELDSDLMWITERVHET